MTTADFYVETAAGETLLSFHNGLSGPATDLLHTSFEFAEANKMAPTRYNVAEMRSVLAKADRCGRLHTAALTPSLATTIRLM